MNFLQKQWFLIGLAAVLAIGFVAPQSVLALFQSEHLRSAIVAGVLFLMALPLEPAALGRTLSRPLAPGLAILLNSVVMPLIAWPLAMLLSKELESGLLIAVAVPCTLASATVWTRKAGGNHFVAILVTVVTNFFCFLTTPFWVHLFTGQNARLSLDDMITKLAIVVVIPMVVAQLLRLVKGVPHFALQQKVLLATLAQIGILVMVCIGAAETTHRTDSSVPGLAIGPLLMMLVLVNVLHIGTLLLGILSGRVCKLPRADQIAIGIAGSQKTLMVGITIALDLGASIFPMLAFHVCQLFVDTLVVQRFAARTAAIELDD
jgi:sodium/bile acid cotransporter 7